MDYKAELESPLTGLGRFYLKELLAVFDRISVFCEDLDNGAFNL